MRTVVSVFGVRPFRIGGTETFARELSRQLAERGWTSVLCFLSEPTDHVREFLSLPNVTLEVLEGSTNFGRDATKRLRQIIRRYKPEILHLHFTGFVGVAPWVARLCGVSKVLFTDHTSRPRGYIPKRASLFKRAFVRIINAPITRVVSVSRYGHGSLTALNLLPADRLELVYNAVDLSRVKEDSERGKQFRARYKIEDDRVLIVQVSWMIPEKGIPTLLDVAQLLVSRNTNVHFALIGEGPQRAEFIHRANAMGLANHITWTGLVEDPFTEGVYDAADIVCQLSDWEELFGWMIAEAMAYRKPIVATNVGGIPELVTNGVSGFLVERGDIESAASRLSELVNDASLRQRMGEAGRRAVEQKFELTNNVSQLIKLYELA